MNQICKVFFLSLLEQNNVIVNTFKHFMTLESFLKKKKNHIVKLIKIGHEY